MNNPRIKNALSRRQVMGWAAGGMAAGLVDGQGERSQVLSVRPDRDLVQPGEPDLAPAPRRRPKVGA